MATKKTEKINIKSQNFNNNTINEMVQIFVDEDKQISSAIEKHKNNLDILIKRVILSFENGGRLIYVGAGTSGRLGVLDAAECMPTFGLGDKIIALIAGGDIALKNSIEGAEDSISKGLEDIQKLKVGSNDVVLGISASGTAAYVHTVLKESSALGCYTSLLTFNCIKNEKYINQIISIDVGPELIAGSTRLKSGTATKMILNMISTISMVKINRTHGNLMVDMNIMNKKLQKRGVDMLINFLVISKQKAKELLKLCKGNVKLGIVMYKYNLSFEEAEKSLNKFNNSINELMEYYSDSK